MPRKADTSAPRLLTTLLALASHRRVAAGLLIGIGLGALGGCASVPNVEPVVDQSANSGANPQLANARGPLSVARSKAILDKLRTQAPDSDILQRHLAIEAAIAESPLVVGNRTGILRDGVATFNAMFAAIHGARDHINLEYYIVEDVESDGEHLGDLLLAKRGEGVQVNVIYDSYGSNATPAALFARLKAGGVNIVSYNPLDPLEANVGASPDDRDHRKIWSSTVQRPSSAASISAPLMKSTRSQNPARSKASRPNFGATRTCRSTGRRSPSSKSCSSSTGARRRARRSTRPTSFRPSRLRATRSSAPSAARRRMPYRAIT